MICLIFLILNKNKKVKQITDKQTLDLSSYNITKK